jgi:hypothetical protein
MDRKTIKVHGLIKGLQVHLVAFPDIMIEMDILVIGVSDAWGMLLSRKTAANLGGNIQMDLAYATIPTPDGSMFKLNRELERKYHVEHPKKPINEIVYRELEMGCYEIESNSLAFAKKELKDGFPNVCSVWDTMDSFDGPFLEEDSNKMDNDRTPLELETELDLSVGNVSSTSTHQLSEESVRCQEELDRIFGPLPPYVLEIGDICFDKDDLFMLERKEIKGRICQVFQRKTEFKIFSLGTYATSSELF